MHTKVVYQSAKALSRIGCAVLRFNFRGAGASAGTFTNGPGEMDDFRAALDFMQAQYPGATMWAAGMSFGAWVALTVGAEDPRVSTLVGIAPPLSRYDFGPVERSTKPKFFIHGEFDEICPLKDDARVLRARGGAERAGRHRRRGPSVRRQGHEVADAIEDLLGIGRWSRALELSGNEDHMQDAVIVSAVRTAVGKAPEGTLRGTRPDELAAAAITEALQAGARGSTRRKSTTSFSAARCRKRNRA